MQGGQTESLLSRPIMSVICPQIDESRDKERPLDATHPVEGVFMNVCVSIVCVIGSTVLPLLLVLHHYAPPTLQPLTCIPKLHMLSLAPHWITAEVDRCSHTCMKRSYLCDVELR